MKLKNKIILLVISLLVFLISTGIYSYYVFSEIANRLSQIAKQNIVLSDKVVELNLNHLEHTELFKTVIEKGILMQTHNASKETYTSAKIKYANSCSNFDIEVKSQLQLINNPLEFLFLIDGVKKKIYNNLDSISILHDICQPKCLRAFDFLEKGNLKGALPLADSFYENEKKSIHNLRNFYLPTIITPK